MLNPRTILQLFKGESIIFTQGVKHIGNQSVSLLVDLPDSEHTFIFDHRISDHVQLTEILQKSNLEGVASVVSVTNFKSQFTEVTGTNLYYFSHLDDFSSKYYFKDFAKEGKQIYILPPLSDIIANEDYKKLFWHRILKPLLPG